METNGEEGENEEERQSGILVNPCACIFSVAILVGLREVRKETNNGNKRKKIRGKVESKK